jgi:hypothetical protein
LPAIWFSTPGKAVSDFTLTSHGCAASAFLQRVTFQGRILRQPLVGGGNLFGVGGARQHLATSLSGNSAIGATICDSCSAVGGV